MDSNRAVGIFQKRINEVMVRVFRRSTQLSYSLNGTRERLANSNSRHTSYGFRTDSRSASALRQKSSEETESSEEMAETPSLSQLAIRQWTRGVVCLRLQTLHESVARHHYIMAVIVTCSPCRQLDRWLDVFMKILNEGAPRHRAVRHTLTG